MIAPKSIRKSILEKQRKKKMWKICWFPNRLFKKPFSISGDASTKVIFSIVVLFYGRAHEDFSVMKQMNHQMQLTCI